jgi:hypothetical protein
MSIGDFQGDWKVQTTNKPEVYQGFISITCDLLGNTCTLTWLTALGVGCQLENIPYDPSSDSLAGPGVDGSFGLDSSAYAVEVTLARPSPELKSLSGRVNASRATDRIDPEPLMGQWGADQRVPPG